MYGVLSASVVRIADFRGLHRFRGLLGLEYQILFVRITVYLSARLSQKRLDIRKHNPRFPRHP